MELVPIRYVGAKARKADTVAGTGLVWDAETVHSVPSDAASKLLRHPDVWQQDGEPVEQWEWPRAVLEPEEPVVETEETIALRVGLPSLSSLSKASLSQLAQSRFGIVLPADMKVADMRAQIVMLENSGRQRGD